MKDVAPAIKCAIFLLKVAAPVSKFFDVMDFPIKSIEKLANIVICEPLTKDLDKILSKKPIHELDWKKYQY